MGDRSQIGALPDLPVDRRTVLRTAGTVALALPLTRAATALGLDDELARRPRLGARIRELMDVARVPGLAFAVTRGNEVAWTSALGFANVHKQRRATPDTPFMLASVSKTVTGVAAMQAVQDGLVDLDADVDDVLPWSVRNPEHPNDPITLRQLLTHTSSMRDDWSVYTRFYTRGDSPVPLGGFLRRCLTSDGDLSGRWFQPVRPGRRYRYCNQGVALAGFIVEAASGTPFDTWCEDRIFDPLGMRATSWHLAGLRREKVAMPSRWDGPDDWTAYGQYGYPDYPDGQLRSSARSLARFLAAFVGFGRSAHGVRILDRDLARHMRREQVPSLEYGQGLIWYRIAMRGRTVLGHTGGDSGVSTRMFFRPADRRGSLVLANGDPRGLAGYRALRTIQGLLLDEG
ncbi:MAG: serine hydrolase domain-containing protein [Actinomycetota bacterium]